MEFWSQEFVSEITFWEYSSFECYRIGSKRAQTWISCTNGDKKIKINNREKFEVKYLFMKPLSKNFWSFDSHWWRHRLENGSERFKFIFNVPVLIKRWKSKVKGTLRWIIPLWNRSLKTQKFWPPWWLHPQNWLKKGTKLVSHVLMVIETGVVLLS